MKKKLAELFTSKKTSAVLFALAGILLAGGVIGGVRAALSASSDDYTATMEMQEVGVDLLENGSPVQNGELMSDMIGEGESLKLGKAYEEELGIRNSSEVDSYVRMILYTSWKDDAESEETNTELNPQLIHLELSDDNSWIVDEQASTPERTVLYYSQSLAPNETTATAAVKSIEISEAIGSMIEKNADGTFTYAYDDKVVSVKAEVDAVQADSGQDAIQSAWGVDYITVTGDGSLILQQ